VNIAFSTLVGPSGFFNVNGDNVHVLGSILMCDPKCSGAFTDEGYNMESGTDCGFTGTGDLQNTNPDPVQGGPMTRLPWRRTAQASTRSSCRCARRLIRTAIPPR
jgi:hypothetical protein